MEVTQVSRWPASFIWSHKERKRRTEANVSKGTEGGRTQARDSTDPEGRLPGCLPLVREMKYVGMNNFVPWDNLAGASGLISRLCSPITLTLFCPAYHAELWNWNRMKEMERALGILWVRVFENLGDVWFFAISLHHPSYSSALFSKPTRSHARTHTS